MALPAAIKYEVDIMTRVVDYGGLFHDDVKPGHEFAKYDHRTFRPAGWVDAGSAKIEKMRHIAERHGLTALQLACVWNLSQEPVKCVAPTFIQEAGERAKAIEAKIAELGALPELKLSEDEIAEMREIGNNVGCMDLKGSNPRHEGETLPDRWAISAELADVAKRWAIDPARDLALTHGG